MGRSLSGFPSKLKKAATCTFERAISFGGGGTFEVLRYFIYMYGNVSQLTKA